MSLVKLLFIDDDEKVTPHSAKSLERTFSNVSADYALTNEAAFGKLAETHYDVILYDLGNDAGEDYPNAHRIRNLLPEALIIALSLSSFMGKRLPEAVFNNWMHTLDFMSCLWDDKRAYWKFESMCAQYGIELARTEKVAR